MPTTATHDVNSAPLGVRLREIRKRRGHTQTALAEASGVSVSLIRKIEQGTVAGTRTQTAHALAKALRVPTSRLLASEEEQGPDAPTLDRWAPVRQALAEPASQTGHHEEHPEDGPTVDGIRSVLTTLWPLFAADQFTDLARLLPPLIREVNEIAPNSTDGRRLRVQLLQLTGWLLTQTRQYEAAGEALERSLDDASNRLEAATSVNTTCWLLLRQGRLEEARALAVRWADDVEPRMSRATPGELAAWGGMLLRVSAASVRDNRPGDAEDALRLAQAAATALGREYAPAHDPLRTFGPVTMVLKRAENASVVGRPDRVLALAGGLPEAGASSAGGVRPTSSNWNRHLLDVADAHVSLRQYGEAVSVLSRVAAGAPEWLPNQRFGRDIVERVVVRRRSLTPEMRRLADVVGLPL